MPYRDRVSMVPSLLSKTSKNSCYRLVKSGQAGGPLAIRGAVAQGIPETVTEQSEIRILKALIDIGAKYSLTYVAPGEWDTTNHNKNGDLKLPYVVVGFSCDGL